MRNTIKSNLTVGAASLALTGTLLLGGCNEAGEEYRVVQVEPSVPASELGQMDENEYDSALAEPSEIAGQEQQERQQGDTTADATTDRSVRQQSVVNYDYSNRDIQPMSLPELNTKVGRLKNQLADVKQLAQEKNETEGFNTLQDRAQSVANQIQSATAGISQNEQIEMTRNLLEVEAEIAEFDKNLTENM